MADEMDPQELLKQQAEEEPTEASGYDLGDPPPADEPVPETEGDVLPATTAFLVIVNEDGSSIATSDVNINLVLARGANAGDMYRGCAEVMKDIQSMETAHRVQQVMLAASQAMMQAQRDAEQREKVQQLLTKGINPRDLRGL